MEPVDSATACVANIGFAARQLRHRAGMASLVVAAVIAVGAWALQLSAGWLALVAFPLFGGVTGVVQARDQTCVALARRGLRDKGHGFEDIVDDQELETVRRQARKVLLKSAAVSAVVLAVLALVW